MPNPKKTKSTIMVDSELWKRLRIITVLNDMEISEFVEEALREKLAKIQQPEQYEAYKDVENIRLPTGQQKQQYITLPEAEDKILKDKYERENPKEEKLQEQLPPEIKKQIQFLEEMRGPLHVNLPGIKFPTTKKEIMESAEKANTTAVVNLLKVIPDREYKSPTNLEMEKALRNPPQKISVLKSFEGYDKPVTIKRTIERIIIDRREIKQEQRKQLLQQQEQQLRS
jgi:hypothetical protein